MTIVGIPAFVDNYIWTIINEELHTFNCVDPGDATPIMSYAKRNGLTLHSILLTHHHADHISGTAELLKSFPKATVYGPKDTRIPLVNFPVHDEDIIHIDELSFRIISTPGHTSTHICYQEPTKGWLFCGDTLFSAGCGRVFDGTIEELHHSINLLRKLPEDTQIFCGHEYTQQNLRFATAVEPDNSMISSYLLHLQNDHIQCTLPSTIKLERQINPFMRLESLSLQSWACSKGLTAQDSLSIFKQLREMKNKFNK